MIEASFFLLVSKVLKAIIYIGFQNATTLSAIELDLVGFGQ